MSEENKIYCKECVYCSKGDISYYCENENMLERDVIGNYKLKECKEINKNFDCKGFRKIKYLSIREILFGYLK